MNFDVAMARATVGFLVRRAAWTGALQWTSITGNGEGGFLVRGAPPPEVAKSAIEREALEEMTIDELRHLAKSNGVHLERDDNKADMVNKILRSQRAAARAKMVGAYEPTDEDKSATDWSEA